MIIISNDCSCYPFYDYYQIEYNHPFIGNEQTSQDFINLVKNFKTINYLNYQVIPLTLPQDTSLKLSIKVDDKLLIRYIHYRLDLENTALTQAFLDKTWNMLEAFGEDNDICRSDQIIAPYIFHTMENHEELFDKTLIIDPVIVCSNALQRYKHDLTKPYDSCSKIVYTCFDSLIKPFNPYENFHQSIIKYYKPTS